MTSAEKAKCHLDEAIKSREARVTILVAELLRNGMGLIDEQPASMLEALIERGELLQLPGAARKHRFELRAAILKYLEQRLDEARARERRLAQAITGAEDLSDDYKPGMS